MNFVSSSQPTKMNVVWSICCGNKDKPAVHISWICVLSLFVLFTRSVASVCKLRQHREKEIELLKQLEPLNGQRFHVYDEPYNYTLGICTTADSKTVDNIGLMQYSTKGGQNFSLGRFDAVGIMGGQNWLLLTYYNGEKYTTHCSNTSRTSHIMVTCDPNVFKGELRALEERRSADSDGCFYLFEFGSKVVCSAKEKNEPPHSLSSGSVFCIIFFTITGIYLLLGFLYQRIVAGSKGLEQIPNYGFWRSFGNLQADGCDYVCRCGPRQESHAYRGIDDRIRTDEERDDQLLNM